MPPVKPSEGERARCVTCGYPERAHGALTLRCPGSAGGVGKTYQTMDLPRGKTCADCLHTAHCVAMYGKRPEDQTCDFFPVRYSPRVNPPYEARGEKG